MMNIEGTPNEKALLVIFAYIIGFVSAFIAFGYALPNVDTTNVPKAKLSNQSATVINTQSADLSSEQVVKIAYENNGLYFYNDEFSEPVLLSKNISTTNLEYENLALEDKQGFHTKIAASKYLTEYSFVYFCEVYDVPSLCTPYLYDINRGTLQILTSDSGPLLISVEEAGEVVATSELGIEVAGYISKSSSRPWEMRKR